MRVWRIVAVSGCLGLLACGPADEEQVPERTGSVSQPVSGSVWYPHGPDLILEGQAFGGARTSVTGRMNVVTANPLNKTGDVWVGSAMGGVWRGSLLPAPTWWPVSDGWPSMAIGAIALDPLSCSSTRCNTVWVGTGENSIRRDTHWGAGVMKGTWNAGNGGYDWTQLGAAEFSRGNITKIVLDDLTPDDATKRLYVALSTGVTASQSHATVTTEPAGALGIWRSTNAGGSWQAVLTLGEPATDLEKDPWNPQKLWAGIRNQGIYRSDDGGSTWTAKNTGIASTDWSTADWVELEVYHNLGDDPVLYAVMGDCPHPHDGGGSCGPAIYRSVDGGESWQLRKAAGSANPYLKSYISYTHALAVLPGANPDQDIVWFGGVHLFRSVNGGAEWFHIADNQLHPDHHALFVWDGAGCPIDPSCPEQPPRCVYDVNDGGFYFGNGSACWNDSYQKGLAVTQFHSVSRHPAASFAIGGTQDNGSNFWGGSNTWLHTLDADASYTLIDAENSDLWYDRSQSSSSPNFRACYQASCLDHKRDWGFLFSGPQSWHGPLEQDPNASGGNHPLYVGTCKLWQSLDDGVSWQSYMIDGDDLLESGPCYEGIFPDINMGPGPTSVLGNPITAVTVAPSNSNRLYVGYYGGEVYTSGAGPAGTWTKVDGVVLPDRPVSSITIDPSDPLVALVAFNGFGSHSVYRTDNAGTSWQAWDSSNDDFAISPVNALAIDPLTQTTWAGTDSGVYYEASSGFWVRDPTLPNVAVYDLEVDGAALWAGTHGRGIWSTTTIPVLEVNDIYCCNWFVPWDPPPMVRVFGQAFDPFEACTITLFSGANVCATSGVDADGATLSTDQHGQLVATKSGYYSDRPMAWACYDGMCAGGVPTDECAVTDVRVTCGARSSTVASRGMVEQLDPPSARLVVEPAFLAGQTSGSFTVSAMMKKVGGQSVVLCSEPVNFSSTDTVQAILERAASELNANAQCQEEGVTAAAIGSAVGGEESPPPGFRLVLSAPALTGVQLVPAVTAAVNAAMSVERLGVPTRGSVVVPRLSLSGLARGGTVRVLARSFLGVCAFDVATSRGESAATVAQHIEEAFLAPEQTPTTLFARQGCINAQNSRDLHRSGSVLELANTMTLQVHSTDGGLSYTIDVGE